METAHEVISKVHDLDLKRLEHFVCLAQDQSFGRAAQRLGIAQPNLTRAIAALEREVGATLFTRSPRGVRLTAAGERLLPRAQSILNEAQAAIAEIATRADARDHLVRLGASAGLVETWLPALLGSPRLAAQDIALEIATGTRETLTAALIAHEIDAACCLLAEMIHGSARDLAGLQFERLGEETLVPFAAPDHAAQGMGYDLAALAAFRWAVPLQMSATYRFESLFFRAGLVAPSKALTASSLALLAAGARDGGMIAILPASYAPAGLSRIAGSAVTLPYLVGILTRRDQAPIPSALATVLDILRSVAQPAKNRARIAPVSAGFS